MKSEIGSININYQDDLRTPGIRPSLAASRKHARHIPKSRIKARLRPQRKQRRTTLDLNFGVLFERATVDFFAIFEWLLPHSLGSYDSVGMPRLSTKRHLSEKRSPDGLQAIYLTLPWKSNEFYIPAQKQETPRKRSFCFCQRQRIILANNDTPGII